MQAGAHGCSTNQEATAAGGSGVWEGRQGGERMRLERGQQKTGDARGLAHKQAFRVCAKYPVEAGEAFLRAEVRERACHTCWNWHNRGRTLRCSWGRAEARRGPVTTKEQVQTGVHEHIVSLKGFCSIDALHLECCPCASQERAYLYVCPFHPSPSPTPPSLSHSLSFAFLLFISWSPPSPSPKARGCQHLSPWPPHLPPLQGLLSCIQNAQWIFFL